jgi:hypothetical protein
MDFSGAGIPSGLRVLQEWAGMGAESPISPPAMGLSSLASSYLETRELRQPHGLSPQLNLHRTQRQHGEGLSRKEGRLFSSPARAVLKLPSNGKADRKRLDAPARRLLCPNNEAPDARHKRSQPSSWMALGRVSQNDM